MFIESSLLDRKRPSSNDRCYINSNNIVYARPNMSDENKTELVLTDRSIALIDNDVQDVCRLLNEFEKMINGKNTAMSLIKMEDKIYGE